MIPKNWYHAQITPWSIPHFQLAWGGLRSPTFYRDGFLNFRKIGILCDKFWIITNAWTHASTHVFSTLAPSSAGFPLVYLKPRGFGGRRQKRLIEIWDVFCCWYDEGLWKEESDQIKVKAIAQNSPFRLFGPWLAYLNLIACFLCHLHTLHLIFSSSQSDITWL